MQSARDIRDGDVHAAERVGRAIHHLLDSPRIADIGKNGDRARAQGRDFRDHGIEGRGIAMTVDHKIGALLGQGEGNGAADILAGAGDNGGAARKAFAVRGRRGHHACLFICAEDAARGTPQSFLSLDCMQNSMRHN